MAIIKTVKSKDENVKKCRLYFYTRMHKIFFALGICINPDSIRDYFELCDIEKRKALTALMTKKDNGQLEKDELLEVIRLRNFFTTEVITDLAPYRELENRYCNRI